MKQQELKTQATFFQWHWNTFPNERGLLHANNNNSVNAIKGNQNMAIGVLAGASDMEYITNGTVIFMEWKTKEGRQSTEQKKFQMIVESQGFRYVILRTLEDGQELVYQEQKKKQEIVCHSHA
jgi:hypothetical protein